MLTVLHMSGSPQQRPANSMPLIDRIKSHAAHVANLTYGPSGDGHRFTVVPTTPPLTEQRGVYFLLSHSDTQIQKVGLANGKGGLRQRMRGYECLYLGNAEDTDPTVALWQRIMTGPLQGQTLSLWFTSLSATTAVEVLGETMTLSWDPHREIERILAREAEACGHPLYLSGRPAGGARSGSVRTNNSDGPTSPLDEIVEPVLEWLLQPPTNFSKATATQFLSSRVVFYPGSGVDYAPMELFKREAHCYLYVDYLTDLASSPPVPNCRLLHEQALTIGEITESLGLDPNQPVFAPDELTPNETQALDLFFAGQQTPGSRLLGGRWSVWERNEVLRGETHPRRFALLQLRAEAVWAFKGLWCTRKPQPKLFALYCGRDSPNWTRWGPGGWLFRMAVNHQAFPDLLRCWQDSHWPDYDCLFCDSPEEGTAVHRRTCDSQQLLLMHLFLEARDVLRGPLTAEAEEQLAQPQGPNAMRFWFRRYVRFLRDTHLQAFEARETNWRFLSNWLDHNDTLDDEASRWQ